MAISQNKKKIPVSNRWFWHIDQQIIEIVKKSSSSTQKTHHVSSYPAGIYLLKVNNRNFRTSCEICSKLKLKTPERCYCRRSGAFIVNFEQISDLVLVFLLLTLSR